MRAFAAFVLLSTIITAGCVSASPVLERIYSEDPVARDKAGFAVIRAALAAGEQTRVVEKGSGRVPLAMVRPSESWLRLREALLIDGEAALMLPEAKVHKSERNEDGSPFQQTYLTYNFEWSDPSTGDVAQVFLRRDETYVERETEETADLDSRVEYCCAGFRSIFKRGDKVERGSYGIFYGNPYRFVGGKLAKSETFGIALVKAGLQTALLVYQDVVCDSQCRKFLTVDRERVRLLQVINVVPDISERNVYFVVFDD